MPNKTQKPTVNYPVPAPKVDFIAYLLGGPKVETFEIDRDLDTGRDPGLSGTE